ncbi:MAG: TonB-dependent receptor plug domain-containing protein, partial [Marinilabiliaceae bacterium]
MASVSARTFSVEEARRYAGAIDDPGRMAGNFSGVTTAGVNVNAIVVRGNAPKGLLWRLEGVDIPVPSHFSGANVAGGGGLTMFSSQLLANSDFYTGAFPAEFGNATAGVFDMKLRNGNNRQREYATQVGVQGIEAATEGPFKEGGDGSFLFNYRYSTMALVFNLLPETSGGTEVPVYQDLSFKLNMPAGKVGNFSVWGIGGLSESTSSGYEDVDKWKYPENREKMNFHYNMGAGGITHKKGLSDKTHWRTTVALNAGEHQYRERIRLDEDNPGELYLKQNVKKVEGKVAISSLLTHKPNSRLNIKTGVDANNLFYNLEGDARDFETGNYGRFLEGSGDSWLIKGHAQGKYKITGDLSATAGFNASWFKLNDEFSLEPRLSVAWEAFPRHRFSLGYGRHSQTEPLFIYNVTRQDEESNVVSRPNKKLDRSKAHHFVLGYDWSPTENLRLKIEPYYQALYDVPVEAGTAYSVLNFRSDWTFDKVLENEGTGRNIGVDLTLERFLKEGYYYMTTASLYDSQYTGGDGVERRSRYDGGYILNLLGGKEWDIRDKNLLGINFKFTFMGPYWYHPVDEDATHQSGEVIYDETEPFTDRHSWMEPITDLTLTYRINQNRTSSIFALQVKNILGRQYQGKQYNLKSHEIENEFFYSPIPFVSYKLEF